MELRILAGAERGAQCVDALVEDGPAGVEVDTQGLELLPYVPGPDAEEQPSAGEVVEGRVLLRGRQGWRSPTTAT